MPLFRPDTVLFDDPIGFGMWRRGHWDEHRQFIGLGALLTTLVIIPDYDFGIWYDDPAAVRSWLNYHNVVHNLLNGAANLTGIDLSQVDLTDEGQWYEWHDDHRQTHSLLQQFFGIP